MDNRAFTDPFGVLGLPSTASKDDVKAAFRRLALKVHPDVDPSPQAAARFREVKRAADVLLKGVRNTCWLGVPPARLHALLSGWHPAPGH